MLAIRDGMKYGLILLGPLRSKTQRAALEVLEPAEADADEDAGRVALLFGELELGLLERHLGRGHRERDEARDLLDLLLLHEQRRIEALDLGREARRVLVGRVEQRDRADAALAADSDCQVSSVPIPFGVTSPSPVTTTRSIARCSRSRPLGSGRQGRDATSFGA